MEELGDAEGLLGGRGAEGDIAEQVNSAPGPALASFPGYTNHHYLKYQTSLGTGCTNMYTYKEKASEHSK